MLSVGEFLVAIACIMMLVGGMALIFATISNNRRNVESLEEANKKLAQMRKEYEAIAPCNRSRAETLDEANDILLEMRKQYQAEKEKDDG